MSGSLAPITNLAGNLKLGIWAWGLQPASWRGLPFSVRSSNIKRGRRIAVHEYPFRDDVWVEDMGRGTRVVSFTGFLIGDDVFAQRDAMAAAAETEGVGELVHPSLGTLQATVIEFSAGERFDLGRVVELEFSFIQSTPAPVFPGDDLSTEIQTGVAAIQSAAATVRSWTSKLNLIFGVGPAVTGFANSIYAAGFGVISSFAFLGGATIGGASTVAGAVAGLPGNNGRYANLGLVTLQPATATVASALQAATAARAAVSAAIATVNATTDPKALPVAVHGLTETVRVVAQSPAEQIRLMSTLAAYQATITTPVSQVSRATAALQIAMAALCRRMALVSLANATTIYLPDSYNAALAFIGSIAALFDTEILFAANAGDIDAYQGLRDLRTAIVGDLTARGSKLPEYITVTRGASLPSLTLAYQLYGDASRSDELIRRVNPIHPCFMPTKFQALAS